MKLDLELSDHNIDHANRIGTAIPTRTKRRLIIVKFVRYADRNKVFTNKKRSKNSGISIKETLPARIMECLDKGGRNLVLRMTE